MSAPLVSVVMPVYNGEPFLADCLESVLAQDFDDFEVLALDDGSTDGSAAILESFARRDSRIQWRRNPRNLGLTGNFNACLVAANGEFIKFVLQDDKLLDRTALRRLAKLLRENPSVALAGSASHVIDDNSKLLYRRNWIGTSGLYYGKQLIARCLSEAANLIGEPTVVMFRKAQSRRGFDLELKQLLDLEMWFHLLEQGQFGFIQEPLCAFRQHAAQQSEVNLRTGASVFDTLILAERYHARSWMKEVATPRMIFRQMYLLRKTYGKAAAPLLDRMAPSISRLTYIDCWIRYKVSRPFQNLRRWLLQRRGST